jgi:hypothetical protein
MVLALLLTYSRGAPFYNAITTARITTARRPVSVAAYCCDVTDESANPKLLVITVMIALLFAAPAIALFVYRPSPPIGFIVGVCFVIASVSCLLCGFFPRQLLRLYKQVEHELEKVPRTNLVWWMK